MRRIVGERCIDLIQYRWWGLHRDDFVPELHARPLPLAPSSRTSRIGIRMAERMTAIRDLTRATGPAIWAATVCRRDSMPVSLPPGRSRLATRPTLSGGSGGGEDDRNGRRRCLAAAFAGVKPG